MFTRNLSLFVLTLAVGTVARAQPRLNIVIDDLLPESGPSVHLANAVGLECVRSCGCPLPYPCGGPCPEACDPACARVRGQLFSRAELSRFGDELGGSILEAGFAVHSSATARLTIKEREGLQSVAELSMTDPDGDAILVEAIGEWWHGDAEGAFVGTISAVHLQDKAPLDGRFNGTVAGTVSLSPLGCGAGGTLEYFYSSATSDCGRGTLVLQAQGRGALCAADVDCSGNVDGDDVERFFLLWDRGDFDFNQDSITDGDDAIAFLAAWDEGCST